MALLRLGICVVGVYSMFLLWAIAQERLSVPFANVDGTKSEKFRSALVMSICQSAFSVVSSFIYILLRRKPGESLSVAIGLEPTLVKSKSVAPYKSSKSRPNGNGSANGTSNGNAHPSTNPSPVSTSIIRRALLVRYLQCALLITAAGPFGFAALAHISYPAMVLGKSCKLVPVMLMNVLLYRRRFAPHKYLVVALVTLGITMFMYFGGDHSSKKHSGNELVEKGSSLIGLTYLLINLAIDGATNSTQDEIFDKYTVTGQQMMFWINIMSFLVTTILALLPLPYIPVLHPSAGWSSELSNVLQFMREHPGVAWPLLQFAFTGSLGQLFIFETLQHFGSLTLVTITLTRKLFTMILSVIIYNHKLTRGQWSGAAVVFAGISVEAWIKRRDVHAKRVMQEKEKAELKTL
ncbi:UAA transporter [Fomitiporia mediterranea MF3/22]|uniref:UAA transporter n=1 Tax=Fomitiporia mediterranea (strain MF3/22) TaxID=694068 RepID=UPI00044098D7|nr:UAA transporter [Fomitiporia mediterranea MF3/22]EJC97988.1 UAA transporter [Fomitiporia mediterranea MF3/22]